MAESSTLERAIDPWSEEGLSHLLEGKASTANTGQMDWSSTTPHIPQNTLGNQIVFLPTLRHNDWWNHVGTHGSKFYVSAIPPSTDSFDRLGRQVLRLQRLMERSLAEGSNCRLILRHSYEPSLQGSSVTWESAFQVAESPSAELAEALTDLDGAIEEAEEHGYPTPSHIALSNARRLVRKLYGISPRRFEVYPTPDAEVAIDIPGEGSSFVVMCDSEGGALCMANLPDGHRARSYLTADRLPDDFVHEALAGLVSDSN